ncbi:endonuclease/exonuclease/phosphatase family protein [Pimephales promelas]|nr:endonuclease/exonuclease/phosphatase family protein [Pimephales promelas]
MKIVTWNINGIRTFKNGIKKILDSFDADIICVQETKVTRDLLDEKTAIVDGYNSYFSFSRGRGGYSGVATYCKDTATPFLAEEGLTGLLTNQGEAVGCYGDQVELSSEELLALDNEGRTVITQHHFMGTDGPQKLTVINVYCPRADPDKPERKQFKLQFYHLLQCRAEAILSSGSHVIVLGDVNTSHRSIDHCNPDDVDNFEDNPGRKWLDHFLFETENTENGNTEDDLADISQNSASGGKFVDSFRHFHPKRSNAFTCWSTLTGARQTNYGTRIDYIFADRSLVETGFIGVDIMPEVEGSDHCPVWAQLSCTLQFSPRCPPLCTRHMPEFIGKQQKLSRFLVKVTEKQSVSKGSLPGSQDAGEIRENLNPVVQGNSVAKKRPTEREADTNGPKVKRSKQTKTESSAKGSLLAFFKPKQTLLIPSRGNLGLKQAESSQDGPGIESNIRSCPSDAQKETNLSMVTEMENENQDEVEGESTSIDKSKDSFSEVSFILMNAFPIVVMEGGTGVYYQAMPAVGPDGKNVMKLIPVQKVNGHFYQTPFNMERDNVDLHLKAFSKPVHPPAPSSSQTQTGLPSLQPIADGRVVLKTLPEFRTLTNSIKTQPSVINNITIHNQKQRHVPLATHSLAQYTVQLPPQPNGQSMTAVQTLPVTVKSPVLPNGHFLQIPPNAKVRTLPATALPQSIKCRIMNSVNYTPNLGKGPPTVVLVSPVNSVKLNSDQQMLLLTKPSVINPPENLQTPVCVAKTNEAANTPIKWVVQEGTGATAPCLVPLSTPDMTSDILKAVKHSLGMTNEMTPSKATPPQASQEKITPGKDNALVMCNGKVYFVAKKNSEIAKDVMTSEGGKKVVVNISPTLSASEDGKKVVVSTSPALPASSALGSNSFKRAPPNVLVKSLISVMMMKRRPRAWEAPRSCEKVAKPVSLNEGGKTAHAEMEKNDVLDVSSAKTDDDRINVDDEQVTENEIAESILSCVSENVDMEADKDLSRSSPVTRYQADVAVAETVSLLEQHQHFCVQATDNTEKVIGNQAPVQSRQPKSDCQLRKEFGITSDVQIRLQRAKPAVKPDQQTERLIINKRTLDGLRKVLQDSKLQSKIQQMIQVPCTETEDDEHLKVKRKKQKQDGSHNILSLKPPNISPSFKCSVIPMENGSGSQNCQEQVCSPTESAADKVHMQSEMPADYTGNTCCISPSPEQNSTQTACHPFSTTSVRKTPPRSKKGKVCTACPCGTVIGLAEATSSLHTQEKPNPCSVVESHKGTRKSPSESRQPQRLQLKDQYPFMKAIKKLLSSPCKDMAPLVSPTSESSNNIISPNSLSASSSSSLQDCNNQIVLCLSGTKCTDMSSSNMDAETAQQDTSQAQTASNDPIMPFSKKHPAPEIDSFPTQALYSLETLDAEEIKRQERIKRLKDLLKEKEAALERMQRTYLKGIQDVGVCSSIRIPLEVIAGESRMNGSLWG